MKLETAFVALFCSISTICYGNSYEAIVENSREQFNVPGIAVGLIVDHEVVLSEGYGHRDRDKRLPVTDTTLFPIASVTKPITANLLGQLVQEGKLSFDDTVQQHIPEFKLADLEVAKNITIRDLLAHRTGIYRNDAIWVNRVISKSEYLPVVSYFDAFAPIGTQFHYNNFMFALAGLVYERVTGNTWEEGIQSTVFAKLGMSQSNVCLNESFASSNYSMPYADIRSCLTSLPCRKIGSLSAAGGINSNVADLLKWIQYQLSEDNPVIQEMRTPQICFPRLTNAENVFDVGYGLGWFIETYRGIKVVHHRGAIDGFSTSISLIPEMGVGIVILANNGSDGIFANNVIRNQIFDNVLGLDPIDWLTLYTQYQQLNKQTLSAALSQFQNDIASATPSNLDDYVGVFEHPAYGEFEVTLEGIQLMGKTGEALLPLYFKTDGVLLSSWDVLLHFGANPVIEISFSEDRTQIVVPFENFRGCKPITFTRK